MAVKGSGGGKTKTNGNGGGREALLKHAKGKNLSARDASTTLREDHRRVEQLFEQFKTAPRRAAKAKIVGDICRELTIHAMLEEEIYYPACREFVDDDMLDEAQVEHDGAKVLMRDLMHGGANQPFYDAKVAVLEEYIRHHVQEEEKRGEGIFAKAKAGGLDEAVLLERLEVRRAELKRLVRDNQLPDPEIHSIRADFQGSRSADPRDPASEKRSRHSDEFDDDRQSRGARSDNDSAPRRGFDRDRDDRYADDREVVRRSYFGDDEDDDRFDDVTSSGRRRYDDRG